MLCIRQSCMLVLPCCVYHGICICQLGAGFKFGRSPQYHHSNKTGTCCLDIEKVSSAPFPTHHKKRRSPPLCTKAVTPTPLFPLGEGYVVHCCTWKHYIRISRARKIKTRKRKGEGKKKGRKPRTPTKSDNDKGGKDQLT
jgi:hypothetical protein